jgi:hypothetical protein
MAAGFDLRVSGAEKLSALARDLKDAGTPVAVKREIYRGLNRATKTFRGNLRQSARVTLPASGGLAARVAGSGYTTRVRTVAGNPSVRIRVAAKKKAPVDVNQADRGSVTHPTFGHKPTRTQPVTPGWFETPWKEEADDVRKELLQVIDDAAAKIRRG